MIMAKEKKNPVLRVRKKSMTDRERVSTMVIPDKKKKQNKIKCRKPIKDGQ